MIVAYIDGGSRGNPGPAGYGVRIENETGTLLRELHGSIGVATNNVAEYHALIEALTYSMKHGYRKITLRSDSNLLVKQMIGDYRVKHPGLKPLYEQAQALVSHFDQVMFDHVPRSKNAEADRLANLAMDGLAKGIEPGTPISKQRNKSDQLSIAPSTVTLNVIAIGLDATDIPRINQLLHRYGDRFIRRIFTDHEHAYCMKRRHPAQHFAGRFAAKEAAMKALGTGHSNGVLWRDVEIVRTVGPPKLQFHGVAAHYKNTLGCQKSLLTITHSDALAFAQVVLLG